VWRIEQRQLRPLPAILAVEMRAELRPTVLFAGLQFAEIRDHSLPRSPRRAKRLDERPIRVSLAVLAPVTPPQKHPSRTGARTARSIPQNSAAS
jgi:hypothetical protein